MNNEALLEELDLKAMTALTGVIQDEKRGLITPAQAATGIRGIFDAVGGLVSQDCFDLISLAALEFKNASAYEVKLGVQDGNLYGVLRNCRNGLIIEVVQAKARQKAGYNVADEVNEMAKKDAAELFDKMSQRGKW